MSKQLIVQNDIRINAPISKVWDALINPEQTPKYMFGCKAISDFIVGNSIEWNATVEGKETTFVTGNIVSFEPETLLAYTTFDPFGKYEDIPENYLTVTYTLSADNGQTLFTVTQGDYALVANGEQRYYEAITEGGWSSILVDIKNLVE
jgi:uncharacterized protein YndB with AHSA1/START domain